MRILTLKNGEIKSPGGINKTIVELNKELSKRGHECIVITTNNLNLPNSEEYCGFEIIRVKKGIQQLYGLNLDLYNYLKLNLKNLKPDIIHVHSYHGLFALESIYIAKHLNINIPIVFTPHYDPLNRSTFLGKNFGSLYNKIIGKKIFQWADHIISISNFEANNIKKIWDAQITVVPHGIDKIDIKKKKKDGIIKLIYVGYLLDYKGVQYIIKSLEKLRIKNVSNVKLTIIGEGAFKEKLINLSKKLNVDELITWKPFLPHPKILEEMQNHDIFLLLSKTEGYGIVVAESLSKGTPAIVTKKTALEEFTSENGCIGVECPPDPDEVANLVVKIYESEIKVGPFSNKIRTWNEVAKDYEKIYFNILKEDQ